jgi:hypothetical protein
MSLNKNNVFEVNNPEIDAKIHEMTVYDPSVQAAVAIYRMLLGDQCLSLPMEIVGVLTRNELVVLDFFFKQMVHTMVEKLLQNGFCVLHNANKPATSSEESRVPVGPSGPLHEDRAGSHASKRARLELSPDRVQGLDYFLQRLSFLEASKCRVLFFKKRHEFAVYDLAGKRLRNVFFFPSLANGHTISQGVVSSPCLSLLPHYDNLQRFLSSYEEVIASWRCKEFLTLEEKAGLDTEVTTENNKTGNIVNSYKLRQNFVGAPNINPGPTKSSDVKSEMDLINKQVITKQRIVIDYLEKCKKQNLVQHHAMAAHEASSVIRAAKRRDFLSDIDRCMYPSLKRVLYQNYADYEDQYSTSESSYNTKPNATRFYNLNSAYKWNGNNPRVQDLKEPPYFLERLSEWKQQVAAMFACESMHKVLQNRLTSNYDFMNFIHKKYLLNLRTVAQHISNQIADIFISQIFPLWLLYQPPATKNKYALLQKLRLTINDARSSAPGLQQVLLRQLTSGGSAPGTRSLARTLRPQICVSCIFSVENHTKCLLTRQTEPEVPGEEMTEEPELSSKFEKDVAPVEEPELSSKIERGVASAEEAPSFKTHRAVTPGQKVQAQLPLLSGTVQRAWLQGTGIVPYVNIYNPYS